MFGSRVADMWRVDDIGKVKNGWAESLAGLSAHEIRGGLEKLENSGAAWPPSLPEFKAMCRAAIDHEAAFSEAVEQFARKDAKREWQFSHPAIYWAAAKIGAFDIKSLTWNMIKARWTKALDEQLSAGRWQPVPTALPALPPPGKCSVPQDVQKKRIAELMAKFSANKAMPDSAETG